MGGAAFPPRWRPLLRQLGVGLRSPLVRRSVATPPREPLAATDLPSKSNALGATYHQPERGIFRENKEGKRQRGGVPEGTSHKAPRRLTPLSRKRTVPRRRIDMANSAAVKLVTETPRRDRTGQGLDQYRRVQGKELRPRGAGDQPGPRLPAARRPDGGHRFRREPPVRPRLPGVRLLLPLHLQPPFPRAGRRRPATP